MKLNIQVEAYTEPDQIRITFENLDDQQLFAINLTALETERIVSLLTQALNATVD